MTYIPTYEREAYYEGKTEGKTEGITEGKLEERLKNARELVKRGIDFTIISESLGLPVKEVEMLAVVVR
jgi:predicted transposase/invertase (TIGR01784 family)